MRDNYLDLARELRKLWNMRIMAVTIVIDVLEKVPRDLERGLDELEIGGQIKII